jgi:hypothetical protein
MATSPSTSRTGASRPLSLCGRPGPPLGLVFGGIGVLASAAIGLLHLDRLPVTFCALKALTGLPCPTCGSTRALGRLFSLDLAGAFSMNPLTTVVALGVVAWAAADLALVRSRRAVGLEVSPRLARWLRLALPLLVLLNWVYLVLAGR